VHIRICAGGCNAVGGTEDQSRLGGMDLFISGGLKGVPMKKPVMVDVLLTDFNQ